MNGIYTYNDYKGFEPTHTTQWVCSCVTHPELNVLGEWCAVSDYNFDYEIENESLTLASLYTIETFKKIQMPKSFSLTFIDTSFKTQTFFENFWKNQKKAIAFKDIDSKSIGFDIILFDKDKTVIKTYHLKGFPTGNTSIRGDQGYSLNSFPVNFTCTSFSVS